MAYTYEYLRLIPIVLLAVIVGMSANIVVAYFKARGMDPDPRELIPRHVIGIGVGFILISGQSAVSIALYSGGLTWRAPIYTVGALLSIWALWQVRKHERRRISNYKLREVDMKKPSSTPVEEGFKSED